jgi:hypothetical protein
MSNTVYDLLYARLHTRKYTTGKMSPETRTDRDVHNASLETNYEMTATMTMVNPETQELRNVTVPRSKVTIIGDQPAGTQPYVIIDERDRYYVHIDSTFTTQDTRIDFITPELNF